MIFFKKSWEYDIPAFCATGITFTYISLFFYPAPQLFAGQTVTGTLLFACVAGILFLAISCGLLHFTGDKSSLRKKIGITMPGTKELKEALLVLCGLFPAIWAITLHWKYTLKKMEIPFSDQQQILELVNLTKPSQLILLILMAVIIIPIVEELVFRRVIFCQISQICGFNIAGFITSGIFSFAHGYLAGSPGLFLAGMTFQWFYSKNNNLAASIMLHALFNAISIILILSVKLISP